MHRSGRGLVVAVIAALLGAACDEKEECWGDETRCGDECVRFSVSNFHCGSCGNECQHLEACDLGECICDLTPPPSGTADLVYCDGICTAILTDPLHCGDCATACPADAAKCDTGHCTACPAGECFGECTDRSTDRQNCGTCGNVCAPGALCFQGRCVEPDSDGCDPPCDLDAGYLCCASDVEPPECAHIEDDHHNCGGCDFDCGPSCEHGDCVNY